MSKTFDFASDLEQESRDSGVAAIRELAKPQTHPDFDGTHCVDCGDDIPQQRLLLGRVRCVSCQEYLERTA